ncbi:hypothetical protein LDB30_06525 [Acidithiobacillus ferrooxidans]|nr:hypothetical protein LDB30_06525 [Acidithiobacillus ferrooxidans]
MSDYQTGYNAGKSAARAQAQMERDNEEFLAQMTGRMQSNQNDQIIQNQANQYQNLLNRFNNLLADYNNLVERFNLRGDQITLGDEALQHSENALHHSENALQHSENRVNILKKAFHYQSAAHSMLMKLPYLATTAENNPGGLDDELRELVADLRELPDGEQEYQDLIAHITEVGRSIADDSVLARYLQNENNLLRVSTQMRDPKAWILQCAELRQHYRAHVHNPMPVSWPDRAEKLLQLMDIAMQVTEATQERRFMEQFYRILVVRLLNAIFGHMAQGRDSTEPEPVAAAFQEALNSDVFPFFPEKRRVHFGSTLRENVFDKDGNGLGTYGDWMRNRFARVLSGMDELYLLRTGNLQALQSLIPQASNLGPQTPDASDRKVANGDWGNVPVQPVPVQKSTGATGWGSGEPSREPQGNPWMQSTPAPKPAEAAKRTPQPPAGAQPPAGVQPSAGRSPAGNTWGNGPS